MAVIYEVVIKAGSYQKDGQDVAVWKTIGRVLETKKGYQLKMDCIPLIDGGWTGWASLYPPDEKPVTQAPKDRADQFPDDSDSIPF